MESNILELWLVVPTSKSPIGIYHSNTSVFSFIGQVQFVSGNINEELSILYETVVGQNLLQVCMSSQTLLHWEHYYVYNNLTCKHSDFK